MLAVAAQEVKESGGRMPLSSRAAERLREFGAVLVGPRRWELFSEGVHRILLIYCFFAPLSIAVAEFTLNAIAAWWLLLTFTENRDRALSGSPTAFSKLLSHRPVRIIAATTALFFFSCFASSFSGIRFGKSLLEVGKLAISLLLPLAVCQSLVTTEGEGVRVMSRIRSYFVACLGGFAIVLLFTVGVAWWGEPGEGMIRPPGPVTGSGQLVLILPVVLALFATRRDSSKLGKGGLLGSAAIVQLGATVVVAVGLSVVSVWPGVAGAESWKSPLPLSAGVALCAAVAIGLAAASSSMVPAKARYRRLGFMVLLGAAVALFLVNLKRGPWIGVAIALTILGSSLSRRLILWGIALATVCVVALPPVRSRIGQFYDDFVIAGGRQQMWTLATDLIPRYPLGIGFRNSDYMRQLDPSLPQLHRHFHSNIINVTVELGLLGLVTYCGWLLSIFREGFKKWRVKSNPSRRLFLVAQGITASLLGWQVAGLFEYNLGDREVRYLALILIGFLLALLVKREEATAAS